MAGEDRQQPRKAYMETDSRGRIHVAVERVRFYASVLGAVAVATGVVMGVSGYLLKPYLKTVARDAMAPEVAILHGRFDGFVTQKEFRDHQRDAEARANQLAAVINQTSLILDTIERRMEIAETRIDRLYERGWRRGSSAQLNSIAPWPPPEDLRPPGWEIWGIPR